MFLLWRHAQVICPLGCSRRSASAPTRHSIGRRPCKAGWESALHGPQSGCSFSPRMSTPRELNPLLVPVQIQGVVGLFCSHSGKIFDSSSFCSACLAPPSFMLEATTCSRPFSKGMWPQTTLMERGSIWGNTPLSDEAKSKLMIGTNCLSRGRQDRIHAGANMN